MYRELYYCSFPDGSGLKDTQSQDIFFQDMKRQNFTVPTPGQERQMFEGIKAKREAYNNCAKDDKSKFLEDLNESRSKAAEYYLRFVVWVAKEHFSGRGMSLGELANAGTIGLMDAVDQFDLNFGVKFTSYAFDKIKREMQMEIANTVYHKKSYVLQKQYKVLRVESELTQKLGRFPTRDEIAQELNCPAKEIEEIVGINGRTDSLEEEIEEDDERIIFLKDWIPDNNINTTENIAIGSTLHGEIDYCLGKLGEGDRRVVELRYGLEDGKERTEKEIANELGITHQRVSQKLESSKDKLRPYLEVRGLYDYYLTA